MNYLLSIECALLADVEKKSNEFKTIDDKTMKGLAYFYGYEILLHGIHLLKNTQRLGLYHTNEIIPRRLYQFHANKNQEHILNKQDYFSCPHNIAIKLHEKVFKANSDIEIERFEVSHEYLIEKMAKLIEQSCGTE
ncbi:unnamed protein product [Rotaria socialis]|uniref:Uncharacterized protein n=1 Tax=Rotaria socialis TaxID=392032 RepID=A0A818N2N9_9BILA|nr:unnamed protein product [Rotaria socialis]